MVGHVFKYGRSHTTLQHTVFCGDNAGEPLAYFLKNLFVQRLEETYIIVCNTLSRLLLKTGNGFCSHISYRAYGKHSHVLSLLQTATFAHRHLFKRTLPIDLYTTTTRIADGKGTLVGQLGRVHQTAQFMLVHGRGYGQVRNGAKVSQVEGSMVRRAILAYQTGAIETKHHGQLQYGHIVNNVVVGALHERGVDVTEGLQSFFGQSGREGDGMAFGYTYVESTVGHSFHQDVHRTTTGHGGCHSHNALVFTGQLEQRTSEDILEKRRHSFGVGHYALTRLLVKDTGCMPYGGRLFGRCKSLALGGVYVEQLRSFHILDGAQHLHQILHIMSIHRAEVTDVHALKHILLIVEE